MCRDCDCPAVALSPKTLLDFVIKARFPNTADLSESDGSLCAELSFGPSEEIGSKAPARQEFLARFIKVRADRPHPPKFPRSLSFRGAVLQ